MAKQSYKIPESLDQSPWDIEVAIRSDSGIGMKPLPLKFIAGVLFSALLWFWMLNMSFVASMSIIYKILFSVVWLLASLLLVRLDKSNTLMAARVPVLISYFPKSARKVSCRTGDNAGPFYSIANIADVDEDRGLITFTDGDVAFVYRVVGSASVLLFPDDRDAILNRVDSFFRNMKPDYEMIFVTCKEAQNVKRQVRNMNARASRLKNDDPELRGLVEMEKYFLEEHVGGSYRSIHQYLILKAHNEEALQMAQNVLDAEVQYSTLMIKRCVALYDDELHGFFQSIYRGKESL